MNLKDGAEYEAKLIRICQKDNEFFSYAEVPLTCEVSNNGRKIDHTVASAAYFGKIGKKLYDKLNFVRDPDTLFISMGVPLTGRTDHLNATIGTAVCAFAIHQINNAFKRAAEECFRGETHVHVLESIKGSRQECTPLDSQVGEDFCGTGINPYIGTERPLPGIYLSLVKGLDQIL